MQLKFMVSSWFTRRPFRLREVEASVSRNNFTSIITVWMRDDDGNHLEMKMSMEDASKLGIVLIGLGDSNNLPKETV